jgi:hypothetical protein
MADQNDFLETLLGRFKVFLVNRYADPRLGFENDPTLRVFIPDLHWISTERMSHFQDYHFNGLELFPDLLEVLEATPGIEVFQNCGAWIEKCTIQGGSSMPSAQFGVQCGNEFRIYQLGPR